MLMLCYHELAPAEENRWVVSPAAFREHLNILAERGYRAVSLNAVDAPDFWDDRTFVLSFDDGREGCLRYALEILAEFQIPAAFYVCPGLTDGTDRPAGESYSRFLDWDEIRMLTSAGHVIGSHARGHRSFLHLSAEERLQELVESKRILEDQIAAECRHFAPPYGYLDRSVGDQAIDVGYRTVASTVFGVNRDIACRTALRRWEIRSPCNTTEFGQRLSEVERRSKEFHVLRLPPGAVPNGEEQWSFDHLAEYDLVVSASSRAAEFLDRFPMRCIDVTELGLGGAASVPNALQAVETAIRERFHVPTCWEVRIDTP